MALSYLYPQALSKLLNKELDYDTDDIRMILLTSSYTPGDANAYLSDIVANELVATGYTANGKALTTRTMSYVAANSWATTWVASTAKKKGQYVRPTTGNGFIYRATGNGTTGATEPTWPTVVGATVADSGVTWTCIGKGATVIKCDPVVWTSITFTTLQYWAIVDYTPGTNATRPLLGYCDYGSAQVLTDGTFTVNQDADGAFIFPQFV